MRAHAQNCRSGLQKTKILEYELAGSIFGLTMTDVLTPGRPIILCVDNSAAASTHVRWGWPTALGATPSSNLLDGRDSFPSPIWIEEVRPALNIADEPSRVCNDIANPQTMDAPNFGAPDSSETISDSDGTALARRCRFAEGNRSF